MSEEIETGVSHIAYFRTDGGNSKLYTQEYVNDLQREIERLNNIIKEVREYIKNNEINDGWLDIPSKELLEILAKVGGSDE